MVAQITSISTVCPTGKLWPNIQENIELRITDCLWMKFIGDWRIPSQMVIDNAESVSMPPVISDSMPCSTEFADFNIKGAPTMSPCFDLFTDELVHI